MSKKRGNSEGSIYQDAEGRWRGSIHLGWANGKRVRKILSGRTRAEVAQKLTVALRNHQQGFAFGAERQTVAQYLKHWLEHVAGKQVRPKTLRTYTDIVNQHLIPALGTLPLQKLAEGNRNVSAGLRAGAGCVPVGWRMSWEEQLKKTLAGAPESGPVLVDRETLLKMARALDENNALTQKMKAVMDEFLKPKRVRAI